MVGRTMNNDKGGLMTKTLRRKCLKCLWLAAVSPLTIGIVALGQSRSPQIGREVAVSGPPPGSAEITHPREQAMPNIGRYFFLKLTILERGGGPHSQGMSRTTS